MQYAVKFNHTQGAANIEWDFGDGSISFNTSIHYCYNSPGDYSVTITVLLECDETQIQTFIVLILMFLMF